MKFTREQWRVLRMAGVGLLVLVLLWGSYAYIVPRTEMRIDTAYHYSYSGIFIQCRLTNGGTHDAGDVELHMAVWNGSELKGQRSYALGDLDAHDDEKLAPLRFYGEATDTYQLVLTLYFTADGEDHELVWTHILTDYQNLIFHDRYAQLG